MQLIYTVSGGSSENFNLQASSGGLSTANSAQLTGVLSDSDGSLTAAGTVSEPVAISTTIDSTGEAIDVFDFTLTDGGTADGQELSVSQIVLNVSGTASDMQRGSVTWRLNGPDTSNVAGVYNGGSDTITFSSLSISVADGASETYTVNAYYNDNTNLTEGLTYILSVDGDTDLTVGGSGTQMGATSAVTNGTGSTVDVTATVLAFTTEPAGSTSGAALTTQPVVTAQDAFGNTDVDFAETVTVTEASAGTLTSGTVAAVSGVATFSGLIYTATADQQSFTLTANDDDGVGSDIATTDASAVISDVVATMLVFDTQPVPLITPSGEATALTTVPVASARDGANVVDTGYSTGITLTEVNGAGAAEMTATGDSDGSAATVTISPVSGVSTFTSMQITYTASGDANETYNLQASSGGLSTSDSSVLSATPAPDRDGDGVPDSIDEFPDDPMESVDTDGDGIGDGGDADLGSGVGIQVANAPGSCNFSGPVSASSTSKIPDAPGNVIPLQLSFVLAGCGSDVTITAMFGDPLPIGGVAYKVTSAGSWTPIPGAVINGNAVTYTVADNGPLDSDTVLGQITDPVTVVSPTPLQPQAQAIPTLTQWQLLVLVLACVITVFRVGRIDQYRT